MTQQQPDRPQPAAAESESESASESESESAIAANGYGAMMQLERGPDGYVRAVPSSESYISREALLAAETELAGEETGQAEESETEGQGQGQGHGWRNRRVTNAEAGTAPAYDTIDRTVWYGEELAEELAGDPDTGARAWAWLAEWVAREFAGCHLKHTPGATGLSLIEHTLPWGQGQPRPYEYPLLDSGLARLIAATSPQHRIEMLTQADTALHTYAYYDARTAYVAYLRGLPILTATEGVTHDDLGEYIPYRPGRYRVHVTVPQGWRHIGLAPRRGTYPLWTWPATPGEEWETWLDERELRLLGANPVGIAWPYAIRERILFAPVKTAGADPCREFVSRIAPLIERLDRAERSLGTRALRAAVRAIAIHPVGLWEKRENTRTRHVASLAELTEADAEATIVPADDGEESGYEVSVPAELSSYQARWRRPEWAQAVYAHERAEATRRALTIPRGHLLAMRGDALHIADYAPDGEEWADTGRVGSYRRKAYRTFPRVRRAPATAEALAQLQDVTETELAIETETEERSTDNGSK